ncbi:MAG: polysaccharide pyruvyl transferase CsaB [Negativicutes bacterium]|jgi:polysaccharide pyruvyl transferase CsaB
MTKVVLSGYYGFSNAGDEAMLRSILWALRVKNNDCSITVISGNPKATAAKYSVQSIYIFDFLAIIKTLRCCDILISGGGSLLQNVTSWRSFYYYLAVLALGEMLGVKVMLYAQGIGPVLGFLPKKIMSWIVNRVNYITVRDEGSYCELHEIGITKPVIEITADAVLGMERADLVCGKELLQKLGVNLAKTTIAIAPRRWGSDSNYLKSLAEAADQLIDLRNAEIVFVPLHLPDDHKVCCEIAALMRNKAVVFDGDCDAEIFMSVIGNCQLLIGVRLHALIFAAIMNVPILGITYDPKIDRFMDSVGLKVVASITDVTGTELTMAAEKCLDNSINTKIQLESHMSILRKKALMNAEAATQLTVSK